GRGRSRHPAVVKGPPPVVHLLKLAPGEMPNSRRLASGHGRQVWRVPVAGRSGRHRRRERERLIFVGAIGRGQRMQHSSRQPLGRTRRALGGSVGPGMYVLGMAAARGAPAPLKKVPTATGIDALFVPFVVAAELKIFEKYGLETSFKPFDDGN